MQDNGQPRKIDITLKILSYVLGLPLLAGFVWISGKFTGLLLFAVITGVCLILAIFVELYSVFIAKRNHLPLFMAGLWAMAGIWTTLVRHGEYADDPVHASRGDPVLCDYVGD